MSIKCMSIFNQSQDYTWCLKCESYHPFSSPDELDHEGLSGEYVPLAEYQKLGHAIEQIEARWRNRVDEQLLENRQLKSLIQHVNEIGPSVYDCSPPDKSIELTKLLKDCKEALG